MPYEAEYKDDGALIRFSGHTTGREILKAKRELFGHRFPKDARWSLCDFTAIDKFDVLPTEVTAIIRQDIASADTHPNLAEVVVAGNSYQYGLARMWEQQVDNVRLRTYVARSREEAEEWLEQRGIRI